MPGKNITERKVVKKGKKWKKSDGPDDFWCDRKFPLHAVCIKYDREVIIGNIV